MRKFCPQHGERDQVGIYCNAPMGSRLSCGAALTFLPEEKAPWLCRIGWHKLEYRRTSSTDTGWEDWCPRCERTWPIYKLGPLGQKIARVFFG